MTDKNRNLLLRLLSAAVLLPLTVWVAWRGGLPYTIFCTIMAALAAGELIWMFSRRWGAIEIFAVVVAGLCPWLHQMLVLPGATIALLSLAVARKAPLEETIRSVSVVALAWLVGGLLVMFIYELRVRCGFGWLVLALFVTWGNDTLAYFTGRALGRHKLCERISPGKTWEGFAGGIAGSLAGAFVARWLLLPDLPFSTCVAIAVGGAVLGPLGDLSESMMKRAAGVKDSGKIIPGHGGVLDRIDALLFVTPWVYAIALFTVGEGG